VWYLLSIADVTSTLILRCGATCGHAGNPLAELLWHRGRVAELVLQKGVMVVILAPGAWAMYRLFRTPWMAL
jgi:hypothetical protein